MKIAVIAAASSPHTIKWVNTLSKRGNTVVLFSMPDHKDEYAEIDASVKVEYLRFTQIQNGYKKNAPLLKSALIAGGFNAVNAIEATEYGFLAANAKAKNLILTVLGPDIYAAVDFGKKSYVVKAMKAASGIIAPSPNMVTRMKSFFSKEKQYFVVPFGVDMELFSKKEEPKEGFVIGTNKALEYHNGVDVAIDAVAKLVSETNIPVKLKIAGSGLIKSNIEQKIVQHNLQDKVEMLGYVKNSQMPEFLNSVDILLQMSTTEAFGVGAIEAMACNVPVVASDTVGASEYILNGVTGYLVKVHNLNACIECIKEFANNKDFLQKVGNAARQDVEELFNLNKCAEKYESALKSGAGRVI